MCSISESSFQDDMAISPLLAAEQEKLNQKLTNSGIKCIEYHGATSHALFRCEFGNEWYALPSLALEYPHCPQCLLTIKEKEEYDNIFFNMKAKVESHDNKIVVVYGYKKQDTVLYCENCKHEWQVASPRFYMNGKQQECKFCKREQELVTRRNKQIETFNERYSGKITARLDDNDINRVILLCSKCGREWYNGYMHFVHNNNKGKKIHCRCQLTNKTTIESAQKRLSKKHPDWTITSFTSNHDPVTAECAHGHRIENNYLEALIARTHCPVCKKEKDEQQRELRMCQKYEKIKRKGPRGAYVSKEEIQRQIREIHPDIELLDYVDGSKPCRVCCHSHNHPEPYEWEAARPSVLYYGEAGGCPECRRIETTAKRIAAYNQALISIGSAVRVIALQTRIATFECIECGKQWTSELYGTKEIERNGFACRNTLCSSQKPRDSRISFEEVASFVEEESNGKFLVLSFTSREQPCTIRCNDCGESFVVDVAKKFTDKPKYSVCPLCNIVKPRTDKTEFLVLLSDISSDIECLDYNGMSRAATFKCLQCGLEWETTPQHIIYDKTGCPKCRGTTSFPEQAISYYVETILGERTLLSPMLHLDDFQCEGDVFIPEIPLLLEFDGAYWHKMTRKRDVERERHFADCGISVIHLWEKEESDEIPDFFINEPIIVLPMYKGGSNHRREVLNDAIQRLLNRLSKTDCEYDVDVYRDKKTIKKYARTKSFHEVRHYVSNHPS